MTPCEEEEVNFKITCWLFVVVGLHTCGSLPRVYISSSIISNALTSARLNERRGGGGLVLGSLGQCS